MNETESLANLQFFSNFLMQDNDCNKKSQGKDALQMYIETAAVALNHIDQFDPSSAQTIKSVLDYLVSNTRLKPEELEYHRHTAKEASQQVTYLQDQVDKLQQQISETQQVVSQEQIVIESVKVQNTKLTVDNQHLSTKVDEYEKHINELTLQIRYNEVNKQDLKKQRERACRQQNELLKSNIELKTMNEDLMHTSIKTTETIKKLQKEDKQKRVLIAEQQLKLQTYEQQAIETQIQLLTLQSEYDKLHMISESEKKKQQEQITQLKIDSDYCKAENKRQTELINKYQYQINQYRKQLEVVASQTQIQQFKENQIKSNIQSPQRQNLNNKQQILEIIEQCHKEVQVQLVNYPSTNKTSTLIDNYSDADSIMLCIDALYSEASDENFIIQNNQLQTIKNEQLNNQDVFGQLLVKIQHQYIKKTEYQKLEQVQQKQIKKYIKYKNLYYSLLNELLIQKQLVQYHELSNLKGQLEQKIQSGQQNENLIKSVFDVRFMIDNNLMRITEDIISNSNKVNNQRLKLIPKGTTQFNSSNEIKQLTSEQANKIQDQLLEQSHESVQASKKLQDRIDTIISNQQDSQVIQFFKEFKNQFQKVQKPPKEQVIELFSRINQQNLLVTNKQVDQTVMKIEMNKISKEKKIFTNDLDIDQVQHVKMIQTQQSSIDNQTQTLIINEDKVVTIQTKYVYVKDENQIPNQQQEKIVQYVDESMFTDQPAKIDDVAVQVDENSIRDLQNQQYDQQNLTYQIPNQHLGKIVKNQTKTTKKQSLLSANKQKGSQLNLLNTKPIRRQSSVILYKQNQLIDETDISLPIQIDKNILQYGQDVKICKTESEVQTDLTADCVHDSSQLTQNTIQKQTAEQSVQTVDNTTEQSSSIIIQDDKHEVTTQFIIQQNEVKQNVKPENNDEQLTLQKQTENNIKTKILNVSQIEENNCFLTQVQDISLINKQTVDDKCYTDQYSQTDNLYNKTNNSSDKFNQLQPTIYSQIPQIRDTQNLNIKANDDLKFSDSKQMQSEIQNTNQEQNQIIPKCDIQNYNQQYESQFYQLNQIFRPTAISVGNRSFENSNTPQNITPYEQEILDIEQKTFEQHNLFQFQQLKTLVSCITNEIINGQSCYMDTRKDTQIQTQMSSFQQEQAFCQTEDHYQMIKKFDKHSQVNHEDLQQNLQGISDVEIKKRVSILVDKNNKQYGEVLQLSSELLKAQEQVKSLIDEQKAKTSVMSFVSGQMKSDQAKRPKACKNQQCQTSLSVVDIDLLYNNLYSQQVTEQTQVQLGIVNKNDHLKLKSKSPNQQQLQNKQLSSSQVNKQNCQQQQYTNFKVEKILQQYNQQQQSILQPIDEQSCLDRKQEQNNYHGNEINNDIQITDLDLNIMEQNIHENQQDQPGVSSFNDIKNILLSTQQQRPITNCNTRVRKLNQHKEIQVQRPKSVLDSYNRLINLNENSIIIKSPIPVDVQKFVYRLPRLLTSRNTKEQNINDYLENQKDFQQNIINIEQTPLIKVKCKKQKPIITFTNSKNDIQFMNNYVYNKNFHENIKQEEQNKEIRYRFENNKFISPFTEILKQREFNRYKYQPRQKVSTKNSQMYDMLVRSNINPILQQTIDNKNDINKIVQQQFKSQEIQESPSNSPQKRVSSQKSSTRSRHKTTRIDKQQLKFLMFPNLIQDIQQPSILNSVELKVFQKYNLILENDQFLNKVQLITQNVNPLCIQDELFDPKQKVSEGCNVYYIQLLENSQFLNLFKEQLKQMVYITKQQHYFMKLNEEMSIKKVQYIIKIIRLFCYEVINNVNYFQQQQNIMQLLYKYVSQKFFNNELYIIKFFQNFYVCIQYYINSITTEQNFQSKLFNLSIQAELLSFYMLLNTNNMKLLQYYLSIRQQFQLDNINPAVQPFDDILTSNIKIIQYEQFNEIIQHLPQLSYDKYTKQYQQSFDQQTNYTVCYILLNIQNQLQMKQLSKLLFGYEKMNQDQISLQETIQILKTHFTYLSEETILQVIKSSQQDKQIFQLNDFIVISQCLLDIFAQQDSIFSRANKKYQFTEKLVIKLLDDISQFNKDNIQQQIGQDKLTINEQHLAQLKILREKAQVAIYKRNGLSSLVCVNQYYDVCLRLFQQFATMLTKKQ